MKTENYLIVKDIGNIFKNQFGYNSRKVKFFDVTSNIEKEIFLHERHAGYSSIWSIIEHDGYNSKIYGSIISLELTEEIIRNVRSYKEARIFSFKNHGIFVVFVYSELNSKGNMQMALKNQLYEYVDAVNVLFDPDELTEDEYLN
jgi:hypothetical protein